MNLAELLTYIRYEAIMHSYADYILDQARSVLAITVPEISPTRKTRSMIEFDGQREGAFYGLRDISGTLTRKGLLQHKRVSIPTKQDEEVMGNIMFGFARPDDYLGLYSLPFVFIDPKNYGIYLSIAVHELSHQGEEEHTRNSIQTYDYSKLNMAVSEGIAVTCQLRALNYAISHAVDPTESKSLEEGRAIMLRKLRAWRRVHRAQKKLERAKNCSSLDVLSQLEASLNEAKEALIGRVTSHYLDRQLELARMKGMIDPEDTEAGAIQDKWERFLDGEEIPEKAIIRASLQGDRVDYYAYCVGVFDVMRRWAKKITWEGLLTGKHPKILEVDQAANSGIEVGAPEYYKQLIDWGL